jgi:DNA processing protein
MTTVEFASIYNREIFAVPGRDSDSNSYGCNYLISKNVANIYLCDTTIPLTLGWDSECGSSVGLQPDLFSGDVNHKEKLLLTLRVLKSATIDLLACRTGFEWGQLSVLLLELELEGLIVQNNNQEYQLR